MNILKMRKNTRLTVGKSMLGSLRVSGSAAELAGGTGYGAIMKSPEDKGLRPWGSAKNRGDLGPGNT